MHSPLVKKMVKTWALSSRFTPHDCPQLVSVVLEDGPQLERKCYWREEAKVLEQQGRVKVFKALQVQILVKGHYADP